MRAPLQELRLCMYRLSKEEDDGAIVREIDSSPFPVLKTYKISVQTGDLKGCGTDATVSINLLGDNVSISVDSNRECLGWGLMLTFMSRGNPVLRN